ncbi:MAG: transposase [Bacteroidota bacterium]
MKYDPAIHHRKSIRLKEYSYSSPGAYFITICTHEKKCLFGEIMQEEMQLNKIGKIVQEEWYKTKDIRPEVELDSFVIMPNHIHGIIVLIECRGTLQRAPTKEQFGKPTSNSIPTIVRLFKAAATKRINEYRAIPGIPVWQKNYYEHIIRNDDSLNKIRDYIIHNPLKWQEDEENPNSVQNQQHGK